ncbi:MAG TPA: patatin-like phospholipase family protein [Anaeromyxobacter sp.]|nr:patatin-like phospholipase family protein [Anaeromyxobacter sp.]
MSHVGLVLTGGGARAAYQVGAIRAFAEIVPPGPSPFGVLSGISAGAINAVGLATAADDFRGAAERLACTWAGLTPDRIYRTGTLRLARIGTRWLRDLSTGGLVGKTGINYLLDPAPLRHLVETELLLGRMRRHVRAGRLRGVAVSATNYNTGNGVTFFEAAPDVQPWTRSTRVGIRARITADHVMASAAIPVFFPPVPIQGAFFGDGCVRMHYPMSPAIHLGAERIVAISQRYLRPPAESAAREGRSAAPTARMPMSEIAGVLLNAVFLDSLDSDLERLQRVNRTLELVPRSKLENGDVDLRPIPALVLRPSQDLGKLAADEYHRFPAMLRYLLKGIGATGHAGEDLLSYLAFEPIYVRRVMDLGYADTMARRDEIADFFRVPQRASTRARG